MTFELIFLMSILENYGNDGEKSYRLSESRYSRRLENSRSLII